MTGKQRIKLAVQMFNFVAGGDWQQCQKQEDVEQILEQLSAAGYDGVEWCNFQLNEPWLEISALKSKMDALGLQTCGMHFHYNSAESLEADCRTAIERCRIFGCDSIIFAYSLPSIFGILPDEEGHYTPEQIDEWADHADCVMDTLEKAAAGTDIKVLYHNHDTEFLTGSDGQYFLDKLRHKDREMDVYWVSKGLDGKLSSALSYVRQHPSEVKLLHMKDGLNGSMVTGEMCGWGKGTFPLQEIVDCAKDMKLSWVVIENDAPNNFGTSGLEDAIESAAYAFNHINFTI